MIAKAFPIFTALVFFFVFNATATVRYVDLNSTNATPPFTDWSIAATNIQDAIDVAVADDLVLVTNGVYQTGGRVGSFPADPFTTNRVVVGKSVVVQSVNGPSVTIIQGSHLGVSERYVRCVFFLTNNALLSGFTLTNGGGSGGGVLGGEPAGTLGQVLSNNCVISNCVIIGSSDGGAVNCVLNNCVLNGNTNTYGWGGGVQNCILNNCSLIGNMAGYGEGGGADKSLLNNCLLIGNTEQVNANDWGGGGASRSTLNNCVVARNFAAVQGGGTLNCTLNNCIVVSNSAAFGGGAAYCTLNNCTIIGNSASSAGGGVGDAGAVKSALNNSIVYYNTAPAGSNNYGYYNELNLNYCCTYPSPTNGINNITNEPIFLNLASGDFHMQSNSPCVNSGRNAYATNTTDFGGDPRIVGGTVDIGAYEFQSPSSVLSYAWAQQYGLPTDGSADFTDPDGDGMNNWQEWIAGTDPTNPLSVLKMYSPSNNVPGLNVSWQSLSTRNYFLQRSTDFNAQPAFSAIKSNIVGQAVTTVYTDTSATNGGPYFYRVGVQ